MPSTNPTQEKEDGGKVQPWIPYVPPIVPPINHFRSKLRIKDTFKRSASRANLQRTRPAIQDGPNGSSGREATKKTKQTATRMFLPRPCHAQVNNATHAPSTRRRFDSSSRSPPPASLSFHKTQPGPAEQTHTHIYTYIPTHYAVSRDVPNYQPPPPRDGPRMTTSH